MSACALQATASRLACALVRVGDLLDAHECFHLRGRYHFPLGDGWSLAVSPESAGRVRLEACHLSRPRTTLCADGEGDFLAGVVLELTELVGSRQYPVIERDVR